MGFFQNLFGKKNCILCSKECGPMSRTKIKNDEFLCNECVSKCSKYIDLYRLTKDEVLSHMEYMKRMEKLYNELFTKAKLRKLPDYAKTGGFIFADELSS